MRAEGRTARVARLCYTGQRSGEARHMGRRIQFAVADEVSPVKGEAKSRLSERHKQPPRVRALLAPPIRPSETKDSRTSTVAASGWNSPCVPLDRRTL